MRYFIKCFTEKQCTENQKELFEKNYSWSSGRISVLEFGREYFPLYLIIHHGLGKITWNTIESVETDPEFKRELRRQKIQEINKI